MNVTSTSNTTATTGTSNSAANTDPAASQDRFLKLLVAQLNNQDPMNPMDNAQMTSQMAQINTVTGIQQLNQTMKDMGTQLTSLQVLQSTSIVGREILTDGNTLGFTGQTGKGAINLAGATDTVTVEIMGPGGQVVDTLNLGAQSAGRVQFDWTAPDSMNKADLTFKVTAKLGTQQVTATPLAQDKVTSIGFELGVITLQLQGQKYVTYNDVRAIL